MATFTSTTLTKRTGATTSVFVPQGIEGGLGTFRVSSTQTDFGPWMTAQSMFNNGSRRTKVRVCVPQLDTTGLVQLSKPYAELYMFVPSGTKQTDVNDLVGYINALSASGLTNFNDILVNGAGVY